MNLIITMAGAGSRFKKAGYNQPKYKIEVCGNNLFSWAMKSLDNFRDSSNTYIFIVRTEDKAMDFIVAQCGLSNVHKFEIQEIEGMTDGQATTAMLAEERIANPARPIAIYNIDTYVEPAFLKPEMIKGDGWIPCFPGLGSHWSFARLDKAGKVVEVREKKRISPHATIGLYWFSSFNLYKHIYQQNYEDATKLEKGEKYIAPLYNQMIQDGKDVYIEKIPLQAVHGLGTPEEVMLFRQQYLLS